MGPLINDSGSQWDIAFGLMPCNTPEAHCNEHIKRAPSSLSALKHKALLNLMYGGWQSGAFSKHLGQTVLRKPY